MNGTIYLHDAVSVYVGACAPVCTMQRREIIVTFADGSKIDMSLFGGSDGTYIPLTVEGAESACGDDGNG